MRRDGGLLGGRVYLAVVLDSYIQEQTTVLGVKYFNVDHQFTLVNFRLGSYEKDS